MSFLTIPSQEGRFTTIKTSKSEEETESRSPMDAEDNNDDDDEDDDTDVRLIPRCSPVPRKRGASIYDETAEYMRIHLALSAGKRVSFADTTGGDLVDVREFVAFDADEEEGSARWEEEEAKYRKPEREPTYTVYPEFNAAAGGALLQAVRSNKVEVERMSPVENEPLAFRVLIRVLNVSFHKSVYIRATMDNWATYFDHPAEYVQGSNDGDTDQFSLKLSFAPPYLTHGSRIEFVVRYETSDGDYWANNSSMNYVVTLLLSYEEDPALANANVKQIRSILKPPKAYSMNDHFDSEDELEKEEEEEGTSKPQLVQPTVTCPVIMQPEIDVEIAVHPSGPSVPPNQELPSADGTLSAHTVFPGEQFPCTSSETTLQTNSSFVLCASESVQPNKSQPLPRHHCELGNQTSEQPIACSPSALLLSRQQASKLRSDNSQADGEEIPPSEASCMCVSTAETNLWSTTGEDGSTKEPDSRPCLEALAECVSSPSVTQGFERDIAVGLSELVEGLSESSSRSAAHHEGSMSALLSPVAETRAYLGAEGEAPPSPQLTSVNTGVTEVNQNEALQSVSAEEEKEDAPYISPHTLLEGAPGTLSEVSAPQSAHDVNRSLMPSIIFLSGLVSLSIVLQEPSTLFFIGLLLVLYRL
ncbi:protein phosphatase 1 regulatory subunit 3A isoform X2 [Acanthochromis polyacanthus]|uniref:protein phosphatase 1 regulatory subunit 3A isoform X2 n=2 Tax=Acanthochromis polyacanthus TaxID=80966 RepID=UPI002234C48E|nr:protein phosphatase 1 regulatory subunit 3A isoform X2 [Acanthochromis polyacanthus]